MKKILYIFSRRQIQRGEGEERGKEARGFESNWIWHYSNTYNTQNALGRIVSILSKLNGSQLRFREERNLTNIKSCRTFREQKRRRNSEKKWGRASLSRGGFKRLFRQKEPNSGGYLEKNFKFLRNSSMDLLQEGSSPSFSLSFAHPVDSRTLVWSSACNYDNARTCDECLSASFNRRKLKKFKWFATDGNNVLLKRVHAREWWYIILYTL